MSYQQGCLQMPFICGASEQPTSNVLVYLITLRDEVLCIRNRLQYIVLSFPFKSCLEAHQILLQKSHQNILITMLSHLLAIFQVKDLTPYELSP